MLHSIDLYYNFYELKDLLHKMSINIHTNTLKPYFFLLIYLSFVLFITSFKKINSPKRTKIVLNVLLLDYIINIVCSSFYDMNCVHKCKQMNENNISSVSLFKNFIISTHKIIKINWVVLNVILYYLTL
jgi:hypothetical protein